MAVSLMSESWPELHISTLDYDRLEQLLSRLPLQHPSRQLLQQELDRANLLEPAEMPFDVVTMNSTVRLLLEASGEERQFTLCYPKDLAQQTSAEAVSVLAPVGMALLGLRQGERILWPMPDQSQQWIRVLEILYQPERSGAYHR